MSTNPNPRWSPSFPRLLALAAFLLFLGAALAFGGELTGVNGHVLLAAGLAALALAGLV